MEGFIGSPALLEKRVSDPLQFAEYNERVSVDSEAGETTGSNC